jgi:putative ABC transport system ATP-binding protein
MNIIKLKNVNLKYGSGSNSVDALKNINLSIDKGQVVAITGASGSGKSTLLNVMSGLDKPNYICINIFYNSFSYCN